MKDLWRLTNVAEAKGILPKALRSEGWILIPKEKSSSTSDQCYINQCCDCGMIDILPQRLSVFLQRNNFVVAEGRDKWILRMSGTHKCHLAPSVGQEGKGGHMHGFLGSCQCLLVRGAAPTLITVNCLWWLWCQTIHLGSVHWRRLGASVVCRPLQLNMH